MLFGQSPNRLCLLRKQHGLSQKQLAALVGQDRTLISMYERGHILPTFPAAASFEVLFGRSVSDIFPDLFSRLKAELEESLQKKGHKLIRRTEGI
jgi:transcriptional regulator with XRE-family HTH domain